MAARRFKASYPKSAATPSSKSKIYAYTGTVIVICTLHYFVGPTSDRDREPVVLRDGWPLSVAAVKHNDTKVCLTTIASRTPLLEKVIADMLPLGDVVEVSTDLYVRLPKGARVNRVRDIGPATKYMCSIDAQHEYYLVVDDDNLYKSSLTNMLRGMLSDRCDIAAGSTWNADGLLSHPTWNWLKGRGEPDTPGTITMPRGACGILIRRSLMSIIQQELDADDNSCKFADDVRIGLIAYEYNMTICSVSSVMDIVPSWLSCNFYAYSQGGFNKGDVELGNRKRYDDNMMCIQRYMERHPAVARRMRLNNR